MLKPAKSQDPAKNVFLFLWFSLFLIKKEVSFLKIYEVFVTTVLYSVTHFVMVAVASVLFVYKLGQRRTPGFLQQLQEKRKEKQRKMLAKTSKIGNTTQLEMRQEEVIGTNQEVNASGATIGKEVCFVDECCLSEGSAGPKNVSAMEKDADAKSGTEQLTNHIYGGPGILISTEPETDAAGNQDSGKIDNDASTSAPSSLTEKMAPASSNSTDGKASEEAGTSKDDPSTGDDREKAKVTNTFNFCSLI